MKIVYVVVIFVGFCSLLKKVKKYVENPKFTPEIVEKVSRAAKSLCMWVRAIELYANVFRTVQPKKQK